MTLETTPSAKGLIYNPIILVTVICCPVATIKNRNVALIASCLLAIVLPIIAAVWSIASISRGPNVGGGGLVFVMTLIVASIAVATGIGGALLTWVVVGFMSRNEMDVKLSKS